MTAGKKPEMNRPKTRRRVRLTGDARTIFVAHIESMYEKGLSIRAIAEYTGRAYGTIHHALTRDARIKLRSKGGKPRQ